MFLCTNDYKDSSGLVTNPTKSLLTPEIFNTVLSRSRSLVVAVGNPFVLLETEEKMGHPKKCWNEYLKLCLKDNTISFAENIKAVKSVVDSLAQKLHIQLPPKESRSDPVSYVGNTASPIRRTSSYPKYQPKTTSVSVIRQKQKRSSRGQYTK